MGVGGGVNRGRGVREGMAATLLSGAPSCYSGAQACNVDAAGAMTRMRPLGLASASCLPVCTQQTRAFLLHRCRTPGVRSVRVASLKDSQREVVRQVDEQSKPVELGSPPAPNGKDRSPGDDSHSPQETADFLAARADEEGVSLKEEVDDEGVSDTVKGTVVATVVLLAFVGTFGVLGVVYKEQINDILTQFSDFLEGLSNFLNFVFGFECLLSGKFVNPEFLGCASAGFLFVCLEGKFWTLRLRFC